MADWPLVDGRGGSALGFLGASTNQATLANAGLAHTKGAYTELSGSLPYDTTALVVQARSSAATVNVGYVIDLAVGASGFEQVIYANLPILPTGSVGTLILPVSIPAGTRLAARMQSSSASNTVLLTVMPIGQGLISGEPLQFNTLYGFTAASTSGVTVDPGGSANTKGAWTQITAASTADAVAISLELQAAQASSWVSVGRWSFDIGVGGAGSEVVALGDIHVSTLIGGGGQIDVPVFGPVPCSIPSGTRLSVRCQCTSTSSRNSGVTLRLWS